MCVCNNASSLGLNRTAIVECCGAQTAELLLVTAVLHLPQSDTHTALEHHFMSTGIAGGHAACSADSKPVLTEGYPDLPEGLLHLHNRLRKYTP